MAKEVKNERPPITSESYMYLHPGESPAVSLVSPVLDSTNYHSWSRSMLTVLSAKNKLQFINGFAVEPDKDDSIHNAWTRCNDMVVSWIIHSVSPQIRHSILWMENAEEIWKDLRVRFFQGDLLHISNLQMDAAQLKQGEQTVSEYFTKMRIIWDELENFRLNLVYCNGSYKTSELIAQRKAEDRAMQFLRGLSEQYGNVKSHVLLMEPLPPISKIFSYVLQQERQLIGSNIAPHSDNKIAAVMNPSTCLFCGKSGHTEAICYKKNGFPNNKGKHICTHCGKTGHTVDVCYKKHGFPPKTFVAIGIAIGRRTKKKTRV